MKLSNVVLVLSCLILSLYSASAQTREDLLPKSLSISSQLLPAPALVALTFDSASIAAEDDRVDKLGHMPRFAHTIATDISPMQSGTWTTLSNGDRLWRCSVSAAGALALIPSYDAFFLPQGATLHIYTPLGDEVIGAFTSANNPASGRYNTGLIHGSSFIIEYYEPQAVAGMGRIHLNEVGYAYRLVPARKVSRDFGQSDPCEVNVPCPEGAHWQDQKNASVRLLVKTGSDYGWCSGTLMNNAALDCTPYILSADHCYQDENNNYVSASAGDLAQWVFYFNYESHTCADPAAEGTLGSHFMTGCTFIAASLDNGGNSGSDFVLVRTANSVPLSYSPYYAGWSNTTVTPFAGVSIHHPNGDIAKVSTYSTPLVSSHWGQFTLNTHWQVQWAPTVTGDGVTEPGSSGSPIFDFDHHVVGTLTGGGSTCNNPTINDLYGQMAYHWNGNGFTSNQRLKDWLDPANTGISTLDGQYSPCAPTLSFDASVASIQQTGPLCDQSVTLTTTLQNFGNQQLNQDSLTFVVDGGSPQSLLWTGALDPLMSTQVSLPAQTFPIGTHTITVISSGPDGNTDQNTANDSRTTSFTVYPAAGNFTFTLQTSDRGSDVYWDLIDANNMIAYSGGPYTNTAQTITQSWCLPVGCYTFNIFNSAGLGLKGIVTDGSYTIKNHSGTTVASLQNVNFGDEESTPASAICSNAVAGVNDISEAMAAITIYPNPSTGSYMITNSAEATSLTITDALGRLVMTSSMKGELTKQIDLSAQDSGVYFFRFSSDGGSATRKVILNKGR